MPIRFHCESCDARMRTPDGTQGRKAKCPRCGRLQGVPEVSAEPVDRQSRASSEQVPAEETAIPAASDDTAFGAVPPDESTTPHDAEAATGRRGDAARSGPRGEKRPDATPAGGEAEPGSLFAGDGSRSRHDAGSKRVDPSAERGGNPAALAAAAVGEPPSASPPPASSPPPPRRENASTQNDEAPPPSPSRPRPNPPQPPQPIPLGGGAAVHPAPSAPPPDASPPGPSPVDAGSVRLAPRDPAALSPVSPSASSARTPADRRAASGLLGIVVWVMRGLAALMLPVTLLLVMEMSESGAVAVFAFLATGLTLAGVAWAVGQVAHELALRD